VLHFQQRPNRPNVLAGFFTHTGYYPQAPKGRAWVSEKESQVVHLESDLVNEVQPIDLKRQHFSIDYKPVAFPSHNTELFSVASEQKIHYPKRASTEQQ
jgi:hypothetical protein